MQRIPISQLNETTLGGLTSEVEVCNEAGVPLGVFVPVGTHRLPGEPEFEWDELREELANAPAELPSLQQIWNSLDAK